MHYFLVLQILICGFAQKWYIPQGLDFGSGGRICISDIDRDGYYEVVFSTYVGGGYTLYFYKYYPPNTWKVDSVPHPNHPLLLWDLGDFDGDGLYDLVFDRGGVKLWWNGISIFESPDSFSYPIQEVWRDTVGQGLVVPICVYDIDQDGTPEIVKVLGDYIHLHIYESIGNNRYEKIAEITTPINYNSSSTLAFGDFDLDSQNEFVFGYSAGQYSIFECNGNNSYQEITHRQLPTANIKDCFTVPDADGDGKLEFVVKGFTIYHQPRHTIQAYIFEATANNTYQTIKYFPFPYLATENYSGGHSDVGDIDGDGVCEIILEGCDKVYVIKSCGNNSFYLYATLPGNHPGGSCVRVTNDLDNNGLNEIVISGHNHTRIYEKTPIVTWVYPRQYDTLWAKDTVYPCWRLDETIALDSLRLYWSHPFWGCRLIYQGLATDTICSWVVPDTQSNYSNRFWLVVKGLGRYDSTSSPVFYIRQRQGISETPIAHSAHNLKLEVYPNPFKDYLQIRYQIGKIGQGLLRGSDIKIRIYNAAGGSVRNWDYETIRRRDYILWDTKDNAGRSLPLGVYFVRLGVLDDCILKKVIKLE